VRRDFLNTILAELYDFFYKWVSIQAHWDSSSSSSSPFPPCTPEAGLYVDGCVVLTAHPLPEGPSNHPLTLVRPVWAKPCYDTSRLAPGSGTGIMYPLLMPSVNALPGRRYVPILAGSAVGRKASSRQTVKARGQFQTFDTKRGWVENQARWGQANGFG
jgi:hypothetical protein